MYRQKSDLSGISHEALLAYPGQTSAGNVDVLSLHDTAAEVQVAAPELEIGVARGRMGFVIFEPVQVLVALAAHFAPVWLLFLHAEGAWVWC